MCEIRKERATDRVGEWGADGCGGVNGRGVGLFVLGGRGALFKARHVEAAERVWGKKIN